MAMTLGEIQARMRSRVPLRWTPKQVLGLKGTELVLALGNQILTPEEGEKVRLAAIEKRVLVAVGLAYALVNPQKKRKYVRRRGR